MIAVCVVLTAAAVSVKFALLRLAPTATLAGTTAAESLLERLTVPPLLPPLRSASQPTICAAPVIVLLLHSTAVTVGLAGGVTTVVPVPLNATVMLPEVASLTTDSVPAADPGRSAELDIEWQGPPRRHRHRKRTLAWEGEDWPDTLIWRCVPHRARFFMERSGGRLPDRDVTERERGS